jgi:glutamate dehydrogenase (NADP+)
MSDSAGYIYDEGIDAEKLAFVMELKNELRGRISEYVEKYPNAKYIAGKRPWEVKCDIALPCATSKRIERRGS